MNWYQQWIWPTLKNGDAEWVHHQTIEALMLAQGTRFGRIFLQTLRGILPTIPPIQCGSLTFSNPLGIAAGFDKDGKVCRGLAELGFGHVEIGTLTPRPQLGNPRPRIFRLTEDQAIINRMGFPNGGVDEAVSRLRPSLQPRSFILGISLGKQKETPLESAVDDYLAVMRKVYPFADYLAINISSPNTAGLRALQGSDYLTGLLRTLQTESHTLAQRLHQSPKPLWLKIAPDLSWDEIDEIVSVSVAEKIGGIIATNTTIARPDLRSSLRTETGGLSGKPLFEQSNRVIRHIRKQCDLPIIGVGGVFSADDLRAKLDAGAQLAQLYTGLAYQGPSIAGEILRALYQK